MGHWHESNEKVGKCLKNQFNTSFPIVTPDLCFFYRKMAAVWVRVLFAGVTARKATITASMETDPAIEEEAGVSPPNCTDKLKHAYTVYLNDYIFILTCFPKIASC